MKVFVSGTKRNIRMEDTVNEKLDALIGQHADILIGDCFGTDKCVQEYLVSRDYEDVTVYVSGDKTRHNAGDWGEEHINIPNASKGFEFYRAKDIEMAKEADYGIAIWDGESKGTFVNMLNLLALNKSCELYLLREKRWIRICTVAEIMPFAGKPHKVTDAEINEILKECGFSREMQEYLSDSCSLTWHDINKILCQAPISLERKLSLMRELREKENLLFELFHLFLKNIKNKAEFEAIQTDVTFILENSIWHSYRDILDAQWRYTDKCETNVILYLFSSWYDTDVFLEKEYPEGAFCFPYQVERYIQKELAKRDGSGEDYYRLEVLERVNPRKEMDELHYEHLYNFYFFRGEICWFEKMETKQFPDGQIYYFPENSWYTHGNWDLNIPTPFRTGDIVAVDCRPFGPPFHALILETRDQYDSCFPNALFRVPYTEECRIASLKHCGFYRDAEVGIYRSWISPLYRLRSVSGYEFAEDDDILVTVKNGLGNNEGKAERFWTLWHESEQMDKSKEQVLELLHAV